MALPLPSALIVNASYDKNTTIVVLPAVTGGRVTSHAIRKWLARADLTLDRQPREPLARLAAEMGTPYPESGLAALRFWGQTGDRPTRWMAAADPVYLEPRLDHLCLHKLGPQDIESVELRSLIDHLQSQLADDQTIGFTRLGPYGYLSAKEPIATANLSPNSIDQLQPDPYLPQGTAAATHRQLISEIEMALHEHEVNTSRVESGRPPINSLWLWGGGVAAVPESRTQPPLFSSDPMQLGYWYAAKADAEPWSGGLNTCLEQTDAGFVADTTGQEFDNERLQALLESLRRAVRSGRLNRLILLFADGLRADVRRSQLFRVWRSNSRYLDSPEQQ